MQEELSAITRTPSYQQFYCMTMLYYYYYKFIETNKNKMQSFLIALSFFFPQKKKRIIIVWNHSLYFFFIFALQNGNLFIINFFTPILINISSSFIKIIMECSIAKEQTQTLETLSRIYSDLHYVFFFFRHIQGLDNSICLAFFVTF